jgi:glycosyltransferase involved in cell wall biosynthesis
MVQPKPNLVVIGNTHSNPSAKAFLVKFGNISREIGNLVYFLTADPPPSAPNLKWIRVDAGSSTTAPARFLLFAKTQLRLCLILLRRRDQFDRSVVLATPFLLPVLLLRSLGKRVFLQIDGKPEGLLTRLLCRANFALASSLMAEAWALLGFWGIHPSAKISRCTLYVDSSLFRRERPLRDRGRVVGFLGALEKGKGTGEMLRAIRLLNQKSPAIKYVIGGSGAMEEEVRRLSLDCANVSFRGQIAWEDVPATLNECRLVVIPSYSEGLPNIMLEAMACGTPVLATPVGGIPDIIADGQTGFIMPDNSPESIARQVLRALDNPALELVAENACRLVQTEFAYEASVIRYSQVISSETR